MNELTRDELAELLRETEKAHGEYERTLGEPIEDVAGVPGRPVLVPLAERE